jgi:hypothetical protein
MSLTGAQKTALVWILLCGGISVLWGSFLGRASQGGMTDFKAVYYGSRCLLQHRDPYIEGEFLRVYQVDGGKLPSDPTLLLLFRRAMPVCINLPTALFFVAPLAMLAWGPAQALWILLLFACLTLAAYLMWSLAERYAPHAALFLICIVLANSELIFSSGQSAAVAVGLCVIAVWCFLKERFVSAGILCMALSLTIKPHDAGLVWLFFLLAGGVYRKRALQTLLVVVVLSVPAVLWVSQISPHWVAEWRANQSAISEKGDLGDPGPESISMNNPDRIIDLQTVISVFRDEPRIYNPVSYLLCGALLLIGAVRTCRGRFSQEGAWLALAALAALSMLPLYHRQYDAKLLLLAIPACVMLWAGRGLVGWAAMLITTAGVTLTGDIPSAMLILAANHLHIGTSGVFNQILTIVLMRPVPLILLAMGIFYLWVYVRRGPGWTATEASGSNKTPVMFPRA